MAVIQQDSRPRVAAPVAGQPEPPQAPPSRLDRLRVPMPQDRVLSWVYTGAVTLVAAVLRLWGIGFPPEKVFDELYYATEGGEVLRQGYENNPGYMFIVHPPLGKWLVAAGVAGLGDNSVGWRVPAAVAGSLCVLIVVRVARRMARSTLLGCVAGLLLAVDGLSVVLSRFALLDIFVAVFVLAGFGCLVVDRDRVRDRLAAAVSADLEVTQALDGVSRCITSRSARKGAAGRLRLGPRPWRVAGGALLGLSCAVKWSGIWFLLAFAVLSMLWDRGARRSAGSRGLLTAVRDLPSAALSLAVAPVAAYLLAWSGWFLGENSYGRHWADTHREYWSVLPGPVRSLIHYHWEMWHFHAELTSGHVYQSAPWSWLVTGRPVLFYYPSKPAPTGCGAASCVRSVLAVGTPALWWAFAPAVLWMGWLVLTRRDWRAWSVLAAFAAGWLSWFTIPGRTMFLFYMAPLVPFLVIGVTLVLGDVLGRARAGETRRLVGLLAVTGYVALVVVDFAWLWPILTGQLMSYDAWHARIWFPSWI
jgi:dolichyl-phosphate-mannose-protein mannosyltransferase